MREVEKHTNRIGLVCEGGGMKCVYGAGITDCFLNDKVSFDYHIGVSAGAANTVSFVSKVLGRSKRFYLQHALLPDYYGKKPLKETGNLFNLEFIYGTLSNSDGIDPIDFDVLLNTQSEIETVATNAKTAKPKYFTKADIGFDNLRVVMASSALPAACNPVEIDGVEYFDGGVSDPIPFKRAFEQGCSRVVVVLARPKNSVKKPDKGRIFYSKRCKDYPKIISALKIRHNLYNKQLKELLEFEKQGKVFIFAPSKKPKVNTFTVNQKNEQQLYDLSIKDYELSKSRFFDFLSS